MASTMIQDNQRSGIFSFSVQYDIEQPVSVTSSFSLETKNEIKFKFRHSFSVRRALAAVPTVTRDHYVAKQPQIVTYVRVGYLTSTLP